jgi:4-hydroxy-tetrahydrodipicolinate synthase
MQEACLQGDYRSAVRIQDRLMPLHTALFVETNPSPAKFALSVLGRMSEEVRLPMVTVSEGTRQTVTAAMVHAGLINA